MARVRRARARRSRAPERFLRPAKIEDRLMHVRAFMEALGETRDLDRVTLVNAAWQHAHEVWPDDPEVLREHADRVARMAEYRAAFE